MLGFIGSCAIDRMCFSDEATKKAVGIGGRIRNGTGFKNDHDHNRRRNPAGTFGCICGRDIGSSSHLFERLRAVAGGG